MSGLFSIWKKPDVNTLSNKNLDKLKSLFESKIPESAVKYCLRLWEENRFSFLITRSRNSCLGNYSYKDGHHKITVNSDLNKYSFLITYIHEVAHLHNFLNFKGKRKRSLPHGNEWKICFQNLMIPLLNESVFPADILKILSRHMSNPAASSTRDPKLVQVLRKYDMNNSYNDQLILQELAIGENFIFKNRRFEKLENRRTRALCLCHEDRKKYTIPLIAEILKH